MRLTIKMPQENKRADFFCIAPDKTYLRRDSSPLPITTYNSLEAIIKTPL